MVNVWVWNLNSYEKDDYIKFCKEKNVKKVYVDYRTKVPHIEGVEEICLIGDTRDELDTDTVINLALKHAKNKRVHLDIELAAGESRNNYYDKLESIITILKFFYDFYVEVDVECWNLDKRYRNIISLADEFALMNYSNSFFKQMWMSLCFRNKPYCMGIETNPTLNCRTIDVDKRIKQFNDWNSWDKNYKGVAVHCWGLWK